MAKNFVVAEKMKDEINNDAEDHRLRNRSEKFDEYRPLLFSIAYRMLSSVTDAEDMVQDAFVRWSGVTADVETPKAYLTATVTNLCLNYLQSARVRREEYIGPWLPEPLVTDTLAATTDKTTLSESLSYAFLTLLERLSPIERAVFLLREVFEYDYEEIAPIVGKSVSNCRQLVRRARQHIAGNRPRFPASDKQREQLLQQFIHTCSTGDLDSLVSLLAEDVTIYTDGGGQAQAARKPIHSANHVARFLLGVVSKVAKDGELTSSIRQVNGQPGLITFIDGKPVSVLTLNVVDNRIQDIYVVANPQKLTSVRPLA